MHQQSSVWQDHLGYAAGREFIPDREVKLSFFVRRPSAWIVGLIRYFEERGLRLMLVSDKRKGQVDET